MKTKLHRSTLQFRAQRFIHAASERDRSVEAPRSLRTSRNLIFRFRAVIALASAIALPMIAGAQAPAPADAAAPAATPAAPPSAPAKLPAAELEKLLMPIALYSDALIATLLPACVYPLEIVQAARFLQDPNNVSKIDEQSWDDSVKAIAKVPAALKKLNDDLQWTIALGEAFLNQDKDVMDMIQALRSKAQKAGTLRTTDQQVIVVTNMIVETKVEERVVVVTNTVVQIQPSPANPTVVYVPTYPPTVYAPPPAYVYDPYAPLVTFAAGVAVGAIIANNCDWGHGGCYWGGNGGGNYNGGGNTKIKVEGDVNIGSGNRNNVGSGNRPTQQGGKWQPDANRVKSSGSPGSAKSMEARGYGSAGGAGGARASTQPAGGNRAGGASASTRPSTPSAGGGAGNRSAAPSASTRPSNPSASAKPSTPSASTRPSTPSASPSAGTANRASPSASPSTARPSSASGSSGAFGAGGGAGASDRQASQRGASSRGTGASGGGASRGGGGGGGGRGGGGGGGGRGR